MSHNKTWKYFEENVLTHSAAHYLLAIHQLLETRGYARVTDVARELEITTGSASTTLKSLRQKDLVREDENKFLSLSPEGRTLVLEVFSRRKLIEQFLHRVLDVTVEQSEIDACKIEHLLSSETASKLESFMSRQVKDRDIK